jgi:hypothetical protein
MRHCLRHVPIRSRVYRLRFCCLFVLLLPVLSFMHLLSIIARVARSGHCVIVCWRVVCRPRVGSSMP